MTSNYVILCRTFSVSSRSMHLDTMKGDVRAVGVLMVGVTRLVGVLRVLMML